MKRFFLLLLSIASVGLVCAGEPSPAFLIVKRPVVTGSPRSQEIDLSSIGQVLQEPKPVLQPAHALPRTLQDDPKLIRDYQQKWETHLNSSQPTPTPVFNPTKIEMLP